MAEGVFPHPRPQNEAVRPYEPSSDERARLDRAIAAIAGEQRVMGAVINGERLFEGQTTDVVMPHDHAHVLGRVHNTPADVVERAIEGALAAAPAWRAMDFEDRAAIFLRAAAMLAGPWRERINAACMLGQSKTAHQAEIDAACELIDFFRFNVAFAREIHAHQPLSTASVRNRSDYRPLEGFVFAVAPFNFLSIAVNLAFAPALMGNVILWKPSTTGMIGAAHCLELLEAAGLPPGVIQLVPGDGPTQGNAVLASPHLAAIHFTGSTRTFKALWQGVASRIDTYRSFPRLVGETGGKDFIVFHESADLEVAAVAVARGAFEYQGQKCSAASRIYVPNNRWAELEERVSAIVGEMKVGDVRDPANFLGAVIDRRAYEKIRAYQELAQSSAKVRFGGGGNDGTGYFIEPTLALVDDPGHRLMNEEIFGPVLTAFTYDPNDWEQTLATVDSTSPYALTGAVFARDRRVLRDAQDRLRFSAGNFYLNDKPTGAVVGQQPFGGGRGSGTNDKAGAMWNLMRWVSPRSIKENLSPPSDWRYPFLAKP
ncbi:MAG: L-glutamate gamma-semialdehyde dehydrogenase [Myxococcota bacterium]